jgi:putative transposase
MFLEDDDFRFFYECLQKATSRFTCEVHAYVFMTNHIHLLMTPADERGIGRAMRSLGSSYVRYFNRRHERTGTLFEGRYRATVITSEDYLFTCYRYVEENPVRSAMVSHPSAYRWSSHRGNAAGTPDELITPHERYLALGPTTQARQSAYRAFFRSEIALSTLTSIRFATRFDKPLSGNQFGLDEGVRIAGSSTVFRAN